MGVVVWSGRKGACAGGRGAEAWFATAIVARVARATASAVVVPPEESCDGWRSVTAALRSERATETKAVRSMCCA